MTTLVHHTRTGSDGDLDRERYLIDHGRDSINPLDVPVSALRILTRTRNCLDNAGILTLRGVCLQSETELMRIPNFGRVCLKELKEQLAEYGLELKPPWQREHVTPPEPLLPTVHKRLTEIEARLHAIEERQQALARWLDGLGRP